MKRKLVRMGQHTVMAAIPASWIQRHGLKAGDHLEFTEVENKLVLTSTAEIYERKTQINLVSPTIMVVWRTIQPAYTSGYDEVKINFKDPKALKYIESSVHNLIGWEIVETGKSHVMVKSISKHLDEEFDTIVRKTWLILKNMMEVTVEAFENHEIKKLQELEPLENTINRYTMFLKRIINRTGYKYPHYMYLLISFLELAANHLYYLKRGLPHKLMIEKEVVRDAKKLQKYLENVYELYYSYSEDNFGELAEVLPHFNWFTKIKNYEIRYNFTMMAEYLVQISRQIVALHT